MLETDLENGKIIMQGNSDAVISSAYLNKRYIEPPPHAFVSKSLGYAIIPRTLEIFIRGLQKS